MIELYNTLLQELDKVTALKWKDLQAGQLQEEQPPIAYPCALIEIANPQRNSISDLQQECIYSFYIDVIIKAMGETNSKTPVAIRSNALQYFAISKEVLSLLQGFKNTRFTTFDCISQTNVSARQGLKVLRLSFQTSSYENTATP